MSKQTKTPKVAECPVCGRKMAPGPLRQHEKTHRGNFHITQPVRFCKWGCGLETSVGALATHERYGCELRPSDGGDARVTCRFCHDVTTLPPAMVGHERVCPANPANPQLVGRI